MENNYVDTLEYLIKIKNEKKKKEPNKIERDQFCAAWVELAVSEGYTERVERYLYSGVSYCGAKPFKEYIDLIENKEQALQSFFAGKMYGVNAETTFRLMVHLFALLLNDKKTAALTAEFVVRFPQACLNKDKKILGNIDSIFSKYFLAELNPNINIIPLGEIGVKKPIYIVDFISAMKNVLSNINSNGLSKNKVLNMDKVQQWLETYKKQESKEKDHPISPTYEMGHPPHNLVTAEMPVPVVLPTVTSSDTPAAEVMPMVTEKELVTSEYSTRVVFGTPNEEHPADMTAYLLDLIGKASKAASAIKAERIQQKNRIDALTYALECEQENLRRANQKIVELQGTIAELRKKLSTAESDILGLRLAVKQKETVIAEKDAEITERIKMADVLSRDRSKLADEALQRLASKIRVEYRDYADALDVPMSCELGENLRLQLQSIFDILEKGGLKIK